MATDTKHLWHVNTILVLRSMDFKIDMALTADTNILLRKAVCTYLRPENG